MFSKSPSVIYLFKEIPILKKLESRKSLILYSIISDLIEVEFKRFIHITLALLQSTTMPI